jgi:ketosteroid isomerase-like protein
MQEVSEVLALESARAKAMIAGDIDAIAALLDDRLIYCHSSAVVDTRQSYLAALNKREYTYHAVDLVKTDHQVVEGGVVIINSLMAVSMTVRSSGQSLSRQIRATSVWVRADGHPGWRLLVSHSTNVS